MAASRSLFRINPYAWLLNAAASVAFNASSSGSMLSQSVMSADEVLRNAQLALKRAKRLGTTQVYEPTEAQVARRRFSIETELRCAIENDDLTLAFHPLTISC